MKGSEKDWDVALAKGKLTNLLSLKTGEKRGGDVLLDKEDETSKKKMKKDKENRKKKKKHS